MKTQAITKAGVMLVAMSGLVAVAQDTTASKEMIMSLLSGVDNTQTVSAAKSEPMVSDGAGSETEEESTSPEAAPAPATDDDAKATATDTSAEGESPATGSDAETASADAPTEGEAPATTGSDAETASADAPTEGESPATGGDAETAPADAPTEGESPATAGDTETTQEPQTGSETKTEPAAVSEDSLKLAERVLSKPGVGLRVAAADDATKSTQYLPNYSILHVEQEIEGWVKVKVNLQDGKAVSGWLKKDELIPWKNQLVAQFTSPNGRHRVLFFDSKETAESYAGLSPEERSDALKPVYDALAENKEIAADDEKVLAVEPEGWAKMQNNFYLLPIIDYAQSDSETDDYEDRPLAIKVTAATENTENTQDATKTNNMTLDVVFAMDLSLSMKPIKEQVKNAIKLIVEAIRQNPRIHPDLVRFGFWGYRDDVNACPGIEFVTKNYTPDELLAPDAFFKVLEEVEPTPVDSIDYSEDVLAGVKDAVTRSKWREDAARMVIVLGDAPGREPGKTDPYSRNAKKPVGTAAEEGVKEIVQHAKDNQVALGTVYINVARYARYLPLAKEQFEALATGESGKKSTTVINVKSADDFNAISEDMLITLMAQAMLASEGKEILTPQKGSSGQEFATNLFRNAMVNWLSRAHKVGVTPEMSGWILDKDIADTAIPSVEPCVLLNRQQLDSLKTLLDNVLKGAEKAQADSSSFLAAFKSVVVGTAVDPATLDNIQLLGDSQFVPSFLKDLPYRSAVMDMSEAYWNSSASVQNEFIQSVRNKINYYEDIYSGKTEGKQWMKLDETDSADKEVIALPLDMLP